MSEADGGGVNFGEALYEARMSKGWRQRDLGLVLGDIRLGPTISRLETGGVHPTSDMVQALEAVLDCKLAHLPNGGRAKIGPGRMVKATVGQVIFDARVKKGWTLAEVARVTGLGKLKGDTVGSWERGYATPSPVARKRLEEALGISLEGARKGGRRETGWAARAKMLAAQREAGRRHEGRQGPETRPEAGPEKQPIAQASAEAPSEEAPPLVMPRTATQAIKEEIRAINIELAGCAPLIARRDKLREALALLGG